MFKKIIVPLDGSETAEQVIPCVINVSRAYGSSVMLLRVTPPFRRSLKSSLEIIDQLKTQIKSIVENYMNEITARLRTDGIDVECETLWGDPAATIIEVAENSGYDLIIIGSEVETASFRWYLGSVSTKVLRAKKNDTDLDNPHKCLELLNGEAFSMVHLFQSRKSPSIFGNVFLRVVR